MRPPGWLQQVDRGSLSPDGRMVIVTFRIRRWHPTYWWLRLQRLVGR